MAPDRKTLEIIAGPNGSGKSTFAKAYFKLRNGNHRFINADTIAAGLSSGNEDQAAFHAGRVMLTAIAEALRSGENFSFESTLSGKNWIRTLERAKNEGYRLTIFFLFLEKISLNIKRIQQRVKEGGHSIPKEIVLRRAPRSFENFWKIYRPMCDQWFVLDNSGNKPKEILSKATYDSLSEEQRLSFDDIFSALAGPK